MFIILIELASNIVLEGEKLGCMDEVHVSVVGHHWHNVTGNQYTVFRVLNPKVVEYVMLEKYCIRFVTFVVTSCEKNPFLLFNC